MGAYRSEVVKLAQSWLGLKESDGSYKKIIDIYNGYKGEFPRGLHMKYTWAWCACTWSALAIKLGYTDIMPIEISCQRLIDAAQKKGIWIEEDGYIPKPGDAILYDWDDNGHGDCTGWADHVGVVEKVNKESRTMVIIEGNYQDSVKRRTMLFNARYIRGFIIPKYDKEPSTGNAQNVTEERKTNKEIAYEVIGGEWGTGDVRKEKLTNNGYDYKAIQSLVNEILNGDADQNLIVDNDQNQPAEKRVQSDVYAKYQSRSYKGTYSATANLYCRHDAGVNKKALCKIPKGTSVKNYGYYNIDVDEKAWLLIKVTLDGVVYTGYCHMDYLKKISNKA